MRVAGIAAVLLAIAAAPTHAQTTSFPEEMKLSGQDGSYLSSQPNGEGFAFQPPDGIYRIRGRWSDARLLYRSNTVSQADVVAWLGTFCGYAGLRPANLGEGGGGFGQPRDARRVTFSCV